MSVNFPMNLEEIKNEKMMIELHPFEDKNLDAIICHSGDALSYAYRASMNVSWRSHLHSKRALYRFFPLNLSQYLSITLSQPMIENLRQETTLVTQNPYKEEKLYESRDNGRKLFKVEDQQVRDREGEQ
jgi:hypothetical protein